MLSAIVEDITTDDIVLPSLPEVAYYLQQKADTDLFSLGDLAGLIEKDPALAARILKAAKSPFYRSIHPVDTVRDAVLKMGLKTTKSLAFLQLKHSSFTARQPIIARSIDQIWSQSTHVAAICCVLSRRYKIVKTDRAMLAGLLHEIGSLLLLVHLDGKVEIPAHITSMAPLLDKQSVRFGTALLRHWSMDPELIDVVSNRHNWQREHSQPADLTDIVLVAGCYRNAMEGDVWGRAHFHAIPAYRKLGLPSANVSESLAVLSEAEKEIEETRASLSI